jgi:hypothetical protein
MKLRIQGSSIRFRLSQSEVRRLACGEVIEERTSVFPQPLIYRVGLENAPGVRATFCDGVLAVDLPSSEVQYWAGSDDVSIESEVAGSHGTRIQLLIEKDFQCLHGSPTGQEDCFPNPQAAAPAVPSSYRLE